MGKRRSQLFAAWYICIGAGFFVLGLRVLLLGGRLWTVILRWVIAAGFVALGYLELRARKS
jgi:hypothetical protein